MPYITAPDDQKLFYRDIGKNKHPNHSPILLLHGFGMNSKHWLPFVYALAHKQRFIVPDFRGFGRSHKASHNQDCVITNYALDLQLLIEQLNLSRIKLAGISMGAFIALRYQEMFGDEHIDHYLHIDQSPKCINNEDWSWGLFGEQNSERLNDGLSLIKQLEPFISDNSDYMSIPQSLRMNMWEQLGKFFADAFSKQHQKHLAKQLCRQERLIRKVLPTDNWPAYIHCLRAYIEQEYDMLEGIKKLTSPMTLLVGLRSEMYPCGGQLRIADAHANCKVEAFENSGHTPLIDQPLKFLNVLRNVASA